MSNTTPYRRSVMLSRVCGSHGSTFTYSFKPLEPKEVELYPVTNPHTPTKTKEKIV